MGGEAAVPAPPPVLVNVIIGPVIVKEMVQHASTFGRDCMQRFQVSEGSVPFSLATSSIEFSFVVWSLCLVKLVPP